MKNLYAVHEEIVTPTGFMETESPRHRSVNVRHWLHFGEESTYNTFGSAAVNDAPHHPRDAARSHRSLSRAFGSTLTRSNRGVVDADHFLDLLVGERGRVETIRAPRAGVP